jgi:hypothetical protein
MLAEVIVSRPAVDQESSAGRALLLGGPFLRSDTHRDRPLVKDGLQSKQRYIADYVTRHGEDSERALEFSCGTFNFTKHPAI